MAIGMKGIPGRGLRVSALCLSSSQEHESHPKLHSAGSSFSKRVEHKGLRARKIFFHPRNSGSRRENKTAPISLHRNEARGFHHHWKRRRWRPKGPNEQLLIWNSRDFGICSAGKQQDPAAAAKFFRASLSTACSSSHQPSQEDIFSLWEIQCHCAHSQADLTFPNISHSCSARTTLSRAGAEGALSLSTLFGHTAQSIPNHQEGERPA